MKRLILTVVIMYLAFLPAANAQQTPAATKYTSGKGGFSVKMPAKPEETVQNVSSADGVLAVYHVKAEVGSHGYLVLYNDYSDPVTIDEVEKILNAIRDGGSEFVKGKVVSEKVVTLSGKPGRSLQIETDETVYYQNYYLVGQRLYQVIFAMPKGDKMPPQAQEFLESFTIIERK